MKRICVFCGASISNNKNYLKYSETLGREIASRGIELVYGGANVGLMGMVAKGCLDNGGKVIGVMPENLVSMGVDNKNITELKVVKTMHERKSMMCELSDGFISLPGGIGTLEETFEIFTWLQLGIHNKPVGILNINNFHKHLLQFMNNVVSEGFLRQDHLDMLLIDSDHKMLLDKLENYKHIPIEKWFDVEENIIKV